MLIPGYNKNDSKITLMNTIYHKSKKNDKGKYTDDAITIIFKDESDMKKKAYTIHKPSYKYFKIKDEYIEDYNQFYIEKDKIDIIEAPYKDILLSIADNTNNKEFYYDNIRSGNSRGNKYLNTVTNIMNSDMDINDYYKKEFEKEYGFNSELELTKSYLDIEVDMYGYEDEGIVLGSHTINAVTVIDGTSDNVYTLLLRNYDNPLSENFMKEYLSDKSKFESELKTHIQDTVGGWKNEIRYGLDKLKFNVYFYEEEIELIKDLFKMLNKTNPDFLLAWNMAFDIPYIIERIKTLGYDPAEIMCHKDFEIKECYYYIDEFNGPMLAERGDYARISSYITYLDQMIQFASRRKGQSAFRKFSLDYIGRMVAGVRKFDFSKITQHLSELPYKNYLIFVIYNIIDTIAQKCIEFKTEDIDFVFTKAGMNCTRYEKCHRNTIYLKNRATIDFYNKNDMIIGNNCNIDVKSEKYPGAIIGDPLLCMPKGLVFHGLKTRLFDNSIDYDYKALYPSLMLELRMFLYNLIGKIIIDKNHSYEGMNPFNDEDFDLGGGFLQDMIAGNYLLLGHRWFGLANIKELIKDIEEYIYDNNLMMFGQYNDYKGRSIVYKEVNKKPFVPYVFDNSKIVPFVFNTKVGWSK